MVKRAVRTSENIAPSVRSREPASPPANDNRQPGLFIAIATLLLGMAVIGLIAWWAFG